jgi:hypothetical protein
VTPRLPACFTFNYIKPKGNVPVKGYEQLLDQQNLKVIKLPAFSIIYTHFHDCGNKKAGAENIG